MPNMVSGAWEKIVMVNYAVSPSLLLDMVPPGTQISLYDGKCFITLAAFVFSDISVMGVRVPFHRHVPEINLRFYVESSLERDRKKGVVFIRELVSKRLLATMANLVYRENYSIKSIGYTYTEERSSANLKYSWGWLRRNIIQAKLARVPATAVKTGSETDYILHNFFGYSTKPGKPTLRYEVSHPLWKTSKVVDSKIKVNFEKTFGPRFGFLARQKPHSVIVTDGSGIAIHRPTRIKASQVRTAA